MTKIWISSVRIDADILAKAGSHAAELTKSLRSAIDRAKADKNPNISEHGRRENELAFREAGKTDLANLSQKITSARKYLTEKAREHSRLADDPAALIRGEQKWRQVERQLDAGRDLHDIVSSADAETARAIAEFGPSWAAAKDYRPGGIGGAIARWMGETPAETVGVIEKSVYTRLAKIDPDSDARELYAAAAVADAQTAVAQPWLDATSSIAERGGADMLGTAVAAQVAQQQLAVATEAVSASADAA